VSNNNDATSLSAEVALLFLQPASASNIARAGIVRRDERFMIVPHLRFGELQATPIVTHGCRRRRRD
jgi:hypothetical protein